MKRAFVYLLLMFMLTSAFAGCAYGSAPGRVYELTVSHQWPATGRVETIVARWSAEVEAATNGQVKITSYPANTLTSSRENYEGVVQGISDIGMVPYSHLAGRFPIVEAFMLPGFASFNNAAAGGAALNEYIRTHNPAELSYTQHLFSFSTGANVLLSEQPLRSVEDLKGLPLGVTQAERANMMNLLGATPISLAMPEWYEALQRNLIVGGITSPEALRGHMVGDVSCSYILNSPLFGSTIFYCVMNIDVFNSLPADCQEVLLEAPDYFLNAWDELSVDAIEFTREKKSVEIISLSDAETARWIELMAPMHKANIDALNARGIDGEALHKTIIELENKYNALYPYSLADRFN